MPFGTLSMAQNPFLTCVWDSFVSHHVVVIQMDKTLVTILLREYIVFHINQDFLGGPIAAYGTKWHGTLFRRSERSDSLWSRHHIIIQEETNI